MIFLQVGSFNVEIAKILGVYESIFLTCLDNNYEYAFRQNKLNANDTLSLSRSEIYEQTGMDDDAQVDAEENLQKWGIIVVKPLQNVPNKNYYVINTEQLQKILSAPNPSDVVASSSLVPAFRQRRVEPVSKRQTHIKQLKSKINVEDPVIQDYLVQWIDSVYANPKGFLSPSGVVCNQNELLEYSNGDQAKQIAILKIAIKNGYRDIGWAINAYEKQNGTSTRNFADYNDIKVNKDSIDFDGEVF